MSAAADRILARTVREGDCHVWQGAVQSSGYGSVASGVKGKTVLAHRAIFLELVGPIEDGLTVDHLCQNKLCMNVFHMEIVTRSENARRKIAWQTHCKRGHELSGDNLRLQTRKTGRTHRVCRACAQLLNEESRARRADVTVTLVERSAVKVAA